LIGPAIERYGTRRTEHARLTSFIDAVAALIGRRMAALLELARLKDSTSIRR